MPRRGLGHRRRTPDNDRSGSDPCLDSNQPGIPGVPVWNIPSLAKVMTVAPELRRGKLARAVLVAVLFLAACQIEAIEIDILTSEGSVLFAIHEKDSREAAPIHTFGVSDFSGNRWEIATFEMSSLYKVQDGKNVLKPIDELPKIDVIAVGKIKFGQVPSGFLLDGPAENRIVTLEEGKVYQAYASRGAHQGHISFKIDNGVGVKLPNVTRAVSSQ